MFLRLLGVRLALSTFLLSAFVFGGDSAAEAQMTGTPTKPQSIAIRKRSETLVRTDVKVVLVPVTVTDELNRSINALSKERFRILEDGVEQKITSFVREDGPVSIGLLFDSSGSMKNKIDASVSALKHVFQTTIPGDEFFLVQFSDDVQLLSNFTPEPEAIHRRLGYVQPSGWTALLDAVALGVNQMKSARNPRRVLLVLSDGNDNNSRFTESEIRSRVMESDVRIFAIALSYRSRLLQRLAEETGGSVLIAHDINGLPDVVQRLSAEIRSQYLIGYSPLNDAIDGKYRRIKVEVLQPAGAPPVRASWRRGYYPQGWVQ
jgi:Ca-activated chloride channel homolog